MLVWPASFGFNEETARNNAFQKITALQNDSLAKARIEFNQFNTLLKQNGVNTFVINDNPKPKKPDAIFPNNWVTFHPNGRVILYPMYAENRRLERRRKILDEIQQSFDLTEVIDISHHETSDNFLEGTGSMIFDHINKKVYACLSARTSLSILKEVAALLGYEPVHFHAVDKNGLAIYHTNVMMAIGTGFVVICLECIIDGSERKMLLNHFEDSALHVIEITMDQMNTFAGNMLEVKGKDEQLIICSQQALGSLTFQQKQSLSNYGRILAADVPTIESIGGGSVRCMMAEIFLPIKI